MPRLFLFFFLLRAAFHGAGYRFPGTLLTYSNKSVSSTPGQREKLLQQKGGEMNRSLLGGAGEKETKFREITIRPESPIKLGGNVRRERTRDSSSRFRQQRR